MCGSEVTLLLPQDVVFMYVFTDTSMQDFLKGFARVLIGLYDFGLSLSFPGLEKTNILVALQAAGTCMQKKLFHMCT